MATASAELNNGVERTDGGPGAGAPAAGEAGREDMARIATLGGAHMVHDTYIGFLSPLLPVIIAALSISKTEAGLLTVFLQGPSALQPVIGRIADRRDLRFLVYLGPALTATMMSLVGLAPSYALLALPLLLAGVSNAAFHSVAAATAGALSTRRMGGTMSLWLIGGEIGATLGPLLVVAAVSRLTMQGTPWLMIGGWLGALVIYLRMRGAPRPLRSVVVRAPWRTDLTRMWPVLLPVAGIILARALLDAALFTFMPVYLTEEGATLWLAGGAISIMQGAGAVAVLLAGPASDRWGRRPLLLAGLVVAPLATFAFLAAGGWVRIPLLVVLGVAQISVLPVLMAVVMESFPNDRAFAGGIYMALMFANRPLAVLVVGGLGDLVGLHTGFAVASAAALLSVPLVLRLRHSQAGPEPPA